MTREEKIRARLDDSADEKEWFMQRESFPLWSVKTTYTNKIVAENMFGSVAEFIANAPKDIDYLLKENQRLRLAISKIDAVDRYGDAKSEFQIGWNGAVDAVKRRVNQVLERSAGDTK